MSKEESYIAELDAKTGASLKLTVLNAKGRIWTLVAGGGASVVYADAIASAGYSDELANYGEYSGAPTETQTYYYARTVLDLMLRAPVSPEGKVLFIGGGIANFTNVRFSYPKRVKCPKSHVLNVSLGRVYIQRCHSCPPRICSNSHRAQSPDLGPPCRTQLPRRPQEHQGRWRRAKTKYACLWARYARQWNRTSGTNWEGDSN